jgi:hypothetical protein
LTIFAAGKHERHWSEGGRRRPTLVPTEYGDAKWLADGSMQPNKPGTPDPTGTLSPLDAEAAKATALKAAIMALAAMSRN